MFNILKYDFGYSWFIAWGLTIPLALAAGIGALAVWRRWPRWVPIIAALGVVWTVTGLVLLNVVWGINKPMALPQVPFLESGKGHVLDAGAGSGRAAIGVLLARPGATVTALDIYDGYWGIEGNTPERFMTNARIAGAAHRADARTGDMREMPFADATFDAVVSSYAIDHLNREGRGKAVAEVARVLKPGGDLLLLIVETPWWTMLVSPPLAHHAKPDLARWRALLQQHGFTILDEGTQPMTRYWLARVERVRSQESD
jgi:ubiquinone/menaquinone biosynthesis C-methylase UbiE